MVNAITEVSEYNSSKTNVIKDSHRPLLDHRNYQFCSAVERVSFSATQTVKIFQKFYETFWISFAFFKSIRRAIMGTPFPKSTCFVSLFFCIRHDQLSGSSHRRCSVKKDVFRNFVKFTEKHLRQRPQGYNY